MVFRSHQNLAELAGWKAEEEDGVARRVALGRARAENLCADAVENEAFGEAQLLRCWRRWKYRLEERSAAATATRKEEREETTRDGQRRSEGEGQG